MFSTSRRGKLTPLMNEESKQDASIQDLAYDFSCRIIRLYQYLTEDILSKMQISLKECNETEYWLQLLHDNGYLNDLQYTSINTDRVRIHKLLNSIVSTTRRKIGK